MPIIINKSKCPQNHSCPAVAACPALALSQEGFSAPILDNDKCLDCGICARTCPMGALIQE